MLTNADKSAGCFHIILRMVSVLSSVPHACVLLFGVAQESGQIYRGMGSHSGLRGYLSYQVTFVWRKITQLRSYGVIAETEGDSSPSAS